MELYKKLSPEGFQSKRILTNPNMNPMNKLPESPIYIFAGGKLNKMNARIENKRTKLISAR